MSRTLELLGRGLLMLALSSYAMGCGDDDDDDDGGADSGVSGTGGTGSGGTSGGTGGKGSGGATGTGGATADGGTPTMSACLAAVDKATAGMVAMPCAACVCEHGPVEATACTAGCWSLVQCYGANCADVPTSDMAASQMCAVANCSAAIAMPGYMGATPLGKVITASCSNVCSATPAGDGGTDDGGT
jgi:hypothetical protein